VSELDATNTAARYQDACFAKLVGSPQLPESWVFVGHLYYSLFHLRCNSVLDTRLPSALVFETFDPVLIIGLFDVIEVLARDTVNLAGLGNILEKFGKFD